MSGFSQRRKEDQAIQASWEPAASLFSESGDKGKNSIFISCLVPWMRAGKVFSDVKHKAGRGQHLIVPELHRALQQRCQGRCTETVNPDVWLEGPDVKRLSASVCVMNPMRLTRNRLSKPHKCVLTLAGFVHAFNAYLSDQLRRG